MPLLARRFIIFHYISKPTQYSETESQNGEEWSNLESAPAKVQHFRMMMLVRGYLSKNTSSSRCFSSIASGTLKNGDTYMRKRIFVCEDILEYSKVSHDSNPLHFDSESARNAGFRDRLVHGMLVASLFPRIISSHFPGAVYVSQSLRFRLPVYVGDEIVGEVQAINIKENKQKYIVKFLTKCLRDGEVVIDGEAMAVLPTLSVEQL